MDTRITRRERDHIAGRKEDDYTFFVSLNEGVDWLEHTHDDFGHAFPATRKQLKTLRSQITRALGEG